ncbi:cytochrome-b5 reductase SCDLUD_001294 [Saccharomycodes ludwigii]|uniref:cytochrome-b5 reductase n=1 Tax=Saccharomycodes ludwigii TaxID=36035 RepID=UPI001E8B002C|nr:hypothetical protein SCDLUD_001294 [Saccharomycodes ludwigii]KAH3903648.1 hypothetical protein SCDLUD_001294 [Saccharomycodes ludwigii]
MSEEKKEGKKEENILDDPKHGILIPSCLVLVGVIILYAQSRSGKILLALPILFTFLSVNYLKAKSRKQSVYKDKWTKLELVDQTIISKNSAIYRFNLKTRLEALNTPVGHHLAVRFNIDGNDQIRYYTPISPQYETGHFDIIVKSYPDGTVSKCFAGLKPGDQVEFQGPVGRFNYVPNSYKEICMIAGGSGITPMLQVISKIVSTPEDFSKMTLIFANETENDILLKDELDEIAEKYPNLKIHYVLNNPTTGKSIGDVGLVTKELMSKYLPNPSPDVRLLICGKPDMKKMLLEYSEELGWPSGTLKSNPDDQVFCF